MAKPLTVNVEAIVTGIRIDPLPDSPRLVIDGVLRDEEGRTVRSFSEDVTDQLPAAAKGALTTIVNRAQAWIDAK